MIAHCSDRKILKFLEKLPLPYTDHGIIIAGGCFKDILTDQIPRDVDLYFRNKESFDYYKRNFISPIAEEHENDITFVAKDGIKIDVIKCQFGSPEEILSRFDFTVTKFALYFDGAWMVCYHEDFYRDLFNRQLVIDAGMADPVKTFERVLKYTRYGYSFDDVSSKIKLLEGIKGHKGQVRNSLNTNYELANSK